MLSLPIISFLEVALRDQCRVHIPHSSVKSAKVASFRNVAPTTATVFEFSSSSRAMVFTRSGIPRGS